MGLFEHFPYTNFHRLNLDWLLGRVAELETKVAELMNFRASWTVTKKYHWQHSGDDYTGGSLILGKSENVNITYVDYRITGRIVQYQIVCHPIGESFPLSDEVTITLPGWIYGFPESYSMYKNSPTYEGGKPAYQGQYNWRHTSNGKLQLHIKNAEDHQYSFEGIIVLAESENEPFESVPNDEVPVSNDDDLPVSNDD